MPRAQLVLILALALLCGLAAGTFVFFVVSTPTPEPSPAPVRPVAIANPPQAPTTVMLPAHPVAMESAMLAMEPAMQSESAPVMSSMQDLVGAPATPRMSTGSLVSRVRRARRDCHAMAEFVCRCVPTTCAQQRAAQNEGDRTVANAARNLESIPGALDSMLQQLSDGCRQTLKSVRESMTHCN